MLPSILEQYKIECGVYMYEAYVEDVKRKTYCFRIICFTYSCRALLSNDPCMFKAGYECRRLPTDRYSS